MRLATWLPKSFSRLNIFLCYAYQDRPLAEEIAQALKNRGHDVFFDTYSIRASSDFNERIESAVRESDRFVFLISDESIQPGKYTLTELRFAQMRWPSPAGRVFPVLVEPAVNIQRLPAYLRSVHIFSTRGNAVAEVAAEIDQTRSVRPKYRWILSAISASLATSIVLLALGAPVFRAAKFELLPPRQIDLRPAQRPGQSADWLDSRVTATMLPIQYTNRGNASYRILNETVSVALDTETIPFIWFNEVELRADGCGADWLCIKQGLSAHALEPHSALGRETMFISASSSGLTWKRFITYVLTSQSTQLSFTITANAETERLLGSSKQARTTTCQIDLATLRKALSKAGFAIEKIPLPFRLSPACIDRS